MSDTDLYQFRLQLIAECTEFLWALEKENEQAECVTWNGKQPDYVQVGDRMELTLMRMRSVRKKQINTKIKERWEGFAQEGHRWPCSAGQRCKHLETGHVGVCKGFLDSGLMSWEDEACVKMEPDVATAFVKL